MNSCTVVSESARCVTARFDRGLLRPTYIEDNKFSERCYAQFALVLFNLSFYEYLVPLFTNSDMYEYFQTLSGFLFPKVIEQEIFLTVMLLLLTISNNLR